MIKTTIIKNEATLYPNRSAILPQERPPIISPIARGIQAIYALDNLWESEIFLNRLSVVYYCVSIGTIIPEF